MKIKPLRDNVLLEADKPAKQSASGILIQEDWKSVPPTGRVLAIGPDCEGISVGDTVLFNRYGSITVEDDIRLCQMSHILGVLNG